MIDLFSLIVSGSVFLSVASGIFWLGYSLGKIDGKSQKDAEWAKWLETHLQNAENFARSSQ